MFGQDKAIEALTAAIKLARAGLREPEKPIGCYLFSGPTGVGKTEVARQLADTLGVKLLRFDMSEYMERHSVSRLIGAPPGYVGFDQGGLLTDGVDQNPYCVLLLDEIEKAHPDLFNILLQIMDHGKLTDHNGKTVEFRNAILIMTTNAGAQDMAKAAYGFTRQQREGDDAEAINRMFCPEFRNRLDATIGFDHLPTEIVRRVVEKFIMQLEAQLVERQVIIELSDEATSWLARRGYDQQMGARPLARVIQEHVKKPLADEVLFGRLISGGTVKVLVRADRRRRGQARLHLHRSRHARGPCQDRPSARRCPNPSPPAGASDRAGARRGPEDPPRSRNRCIDRDRACRRRAERSLRLARLPSGRQARALSIAGLVMAASFLGFGACSQGLEFDLVVGASDRADRLGAAGPGRPRRFPAERRRPVRDRAWP